jgi:phosphoribulokinase
MDQKQQAAKTEINKLAIELIALVNRESPLLDREISRIREIGSQISYESNDLNDYEAFAKLFDIAS